MHVRRHPSRHSHRSRLLIVLSLLVGLLPVSGIAGLGHAAADVPAAGQFVPVSETRVIDTTTGLGGRATPLASGTLGASSRWDFTISGKGGVPTSGVLAVLVHLTVSHGSDYGYVQAWQSGAPRPALSTVDILNTGAANDNSAFVQVSAGGQISFWDASPSSVDLAVDVEGYVTNSSNGTAGATYAPVAPQRIVDTSAGTGPLKSPLTATAQSMPVLGVAGIPSTGVSAVVLNVGERNSSGAGYISVYPQGGTPTTKLDAVSDDPTGFAQQMVVVKPGSSGGVSFASEGGTADIHVDVEGYFLAASATSSGDIYVPLPATRIVSTTTDQGLSGPLAPATYASSPTTNVPNPALSPVPVLGVAGVPDTAVDAVALNVTTLNATGNGYVEVWSDGIDKPTPASSVNVDAGRHNNNLVFVQPGDDGDIAVYNSVGDTSDLLIDVEGYFQDPDTACQPMTPMATTAAQDPTTGQSVQVLNWAVDDLVVSETLPPAGFNAATASADQLDFYGLPDRPAADDQAATAAWTDDVATPVAAPASLQPITSDDVCTDPTSTVAVAASDVDGDVDTDAADADSADSAPTYHSDNWAGEVATASNTYRYVQAEYHQPSATDCPGSGASSHGTWVGIGGNGLKTNLLQNGTASGGGSGGALKPYAWWEALDHNKDKNSLHRVSAKAMPVAVGDHMFVHTHYVTGSHPHVTFYWANLTQKVAFSLKVTGKKDSTKETTYEPGHIANYYTGTSAEAIDERLENVNTDKYTRNRQHSQTGWNNVGVGDSSPGQNIRGVTHFRDVMRTVDHKTTLEVPTGAGNDLNAFNSTWKHCGTVDPAPKS